MPSQTLLKSAHSGNPMPDGLNSSHQALWLEQSGNWQEAHDMCESVPDPAGSWIHAYLHRVEGDLSNASYWYHRASKEIPTCSLEQEWLQLVDALA
ncbi:MAG: hypothetical protein ABGY95_12545 [Rubritalea sp.]|uniref:hypothetical protein n=1 Tax=Rubritalea sp. TaxID=2109375 RepID=UPI00324220D0